VFEDDRVGGAQLLHGRLVAAAAVRVVPLRKLSVPFTDILRARRPVQIQTSVRLCHGVEAGAHRPYAAAKGSPCAKGDLMHSPVCHSAANGRDGIEKK